MKAVAGYPGKPDGATHRIDGLDHYDGAPGLLGAPGVIKAYVEIAG